MEFSIQLTVDEMNKIKNYKIYLNIYIYICIT